MMTLCPGDLVYVMGSGSSLITKLSIGHDWWDWEGYSGFHHDDNPGIVVSVIRFQWTETRVVYVVSPQAIGWNLSKDYGLELSHLEN